MQRSQSGLALAALLVLAASLLLWRSDAEHDGSGEAVEPRPTPTQQPTKSWEVASIEPPKSDARTEVEARTRTSSELSSAANAGSRLLASIGGAPAPTKFVEVRVLTEDQPTRDVSVAMEFDSGEESAFVERRSLSATTDGNGIAVFEVSWYFRSAEAVVLAPGGARLAKSIERRDDERWRVELRLGSARVEGAVFDLRGEPAADAQVLLRCEAGDWFAITYSRADGSYAFDFVAAGAVQIATLTEPMSYTPGHRARFQLTAHETRRLDLGGREQPRSWSGRLLAPSGAPLEYALELRAVERTREWTTQFSSDSTGRFRFEIAPGDYDLFTDGRREPLALGALTIAESSDVFRQDIVLPARIVYGSVNWSDDGSAVNGRELTLAAANDYLSVSIRGGRFCALALHDAEYMVSVHDEELADAPGGYVWVTTESGSEVQLHLRLVR